MIYNLKKHLKVIHILHVFKFLSAQSFKKHLRFYIAWPTHWNSSLQKQALIFTNKFIWALMMYQFMLQCSYFHWKMFIVFRYLDHFGYILPPQTTVCKQSSWHGTKFLRKILWIGLLYNIQLPSILPV